MKQRIFSLFTILFICIVTCFALTSCSSKNFYPNGFMEDANFDDSLGQEIMFGESYNQINENPFYNTEYAESSYFSMDSFTASYSNLRRFIENNQKISGNIIKTDELLNYFTYDLETPKGDETFKVTAEMSVAPWNEEHHVITIGVATEEAEYIESDGNNIVFLIDVSGSMSSSNKLPLLKDAFLLLLEKLNPSDRISIVTYASGVDVKADGIFADNVSKLNRVINRLTASGSTNGSGGIQKAYELAEKYYVENGINRVILATDGDFNVGIRDNDELKEFIQDKAKSGVYLTVLGFGMGNYQDSKVETLAKYGNGLYAYVDSLEEAKKVLVDDFNKTMITVAKDVKNKVTFNKDLVESYRLIGYENKTISADDFENEEADAGELGSGHQTLVTYEVVLKDNVYDSYQEIFNLQINYKDPDTLESKTFKYQALDVDLYNKEASEDHNFALCLVEFSLILRNSTYRGTASYEHLLNNLSKLQCVKNDELKNEFYELVKTAYSHDLIEYPEYEDSKEGEVIVTIYTSFGTLNARYSYNSIINYNSVMLSIFGKIPTNKTFKVCLDPNMENELTTITAKSNIELYVIELK